MLFIILVMGTHIQLTVSWYFATFRQLQRQLVPYIQWWNVCLVLSAFWWVRPTYNILHADSSQYLSARMVFHLSHSDHIIDALAYRHCMAVAVQELIQYEIAVLSSSSPRDCAAALFRSARSECPICRIGDSLSSASTDRATIYLLQQSNL